jgi:hypothetical protein
VRPTPGVAIWVAVHPGTSLFTEVRACGLTCGANAHEPLRTRSAQAFNSVVHGRRGDPDAGAAGAVGSASSMQGAGDASWWSPQPPFCLGSFYCLPKPGRTDRPDYKGWAAAGAACVDDACQDSRPGVPAGVVALYFGERASVFIVVRLCDHGLVLRLDWSQVPFVSNAGRGHSIRHRQSYGR